MFSKQKKENYFESFCATFRFQDLETESTSDIEEEVQTCCSASTLEWRCTRDFSLFYFFILPWEFSFFEVDTQENQNNFHQDTLSTPQGIQSKMSRNFLSLLLGRVQNNKHRKELINVTSKRFKIFLCTRWGREWVNLSLFSSRLIRRIRS